VPLKGLSAISDLLPPEGYANPGWAEVYDKEIMKFRRLAAFSAFWSGISKAELEARTNSLPATPMRGSPGTAEASSPVKRARRGA
jgi:hypothetical protein